MNKAIVKMDTWHNTGEDENYCVGDIYISDCGEPVVCASSLDTGCYDEWYLKAFYREFTRVSDPEDSFR